jgi:hypothetical protein
MQNLRTKIGEEIKYKVLYSVSIRVNCMEIENSTRLSLDHHVMISTITNQLIFGLNWAVRDKINEKLRTYYTQKI